MLRFVQAATLQIDNDKLVLKLAPLCGHDWVQDRQDEAGPGALQVTSFAAQDGLLAPAADPGLLALRPKNLKRRKQGELPPATAADAEPALAPPVGAAGVADAPPAPRKLRRQAGAAAAGQAQGRKSGSYNLPLDVIEDELKYTLFADVPGLGEPDLTISLSKDNVLSISGERKSASEEPEGVVSQECPVGAFKRQWTLPEDTDGAAISAKVTDGVLTITVGKKLKEPEAELEPIKIAWV